VLEHQFDYHNTTIHKQIKGD